MLWPGKSWPVGFTSMF